MEYLFGAFSLLAVLDKVTGNHFKLGEEFEKGIKATGNLILSMVGMIVLSPVIAKGLTYIFQPLTEFLNMDISVVAGFIPNDAGGAALAYQLSESSLWAGYNGMIVASMLGAAILLIPMALRMADKIYYDDIFSGLLCGIATMPIGCIVGGLMAGCPIWKLLINSIPLIVISSIICIGQVYNPNLCIKIFGIVGNILTIIIYVGLGLGIFESLTDIVIIQGLTPIGEAMDIVASVAFVLSGVLPLLAVVSRVFGKLFDRFGKVLNVNDKSILGLITTLANVIPTLGFIDKMDRKGRIMNMAFAVSAAYIIGDHLAFTMIFDRTYLPSVILGKLVSGITALVVACLMYRKIDKSDR